MNKQLHQLPICHKELGDQVHIPIPKTVQYSSLQYRVLKYSSTVLKYRTVDSTIAQAFH